ncbi:hypothetical protein V8F06_013939 [Rhypophila decipiens]
MSDTQGKCQQNTGTCRVVDCANQPTDIPEYADISGLGVLLGFLIAAYLVIIFLIGYYVFTFDPRLDIFRAEDDTTSIAPTINIVDDFVLRKVHYVLRKTRQTPPFSYLWSENPDKGKEFHKVMNQCVYALVDSQSITGIAILVSGYYSLHCGVSSYHWYLIVYLAWFASLTHLSGLTFLRHHLHNHQGARSWRLFCMFVLLVLLAVALFPTAHFDLSYIDYNNGNIIDEDNAGKDFKLTDHAVCYFKIKEEPYGILPDRWDSMVVSMALLVYGYLIRALKLFRGPRGTWYRFKRKWKDSCQKFLRWMASLPSEHWPAWMRFTYGAVLVKPCVLFYLLLRGLLHYYVSMASEIYWLLVSAAWGTFRLFYLKFSNGAPPEDDWSFGQLVPLLMLASPLVLLYEYIVRAIKATLARKREERKLSSRDLESEPRRRHTEPVPDKTKLLKIPESSHNHQENRQTGESLLQVPRQTQPATRSDSDSTLFPNPLRKR